MTEEDAGQLGVDWQAGSGDECCSLHATLQPQDDVPYLCLSPEDVSEPTEVCPVRAAGCTLRLPHTLTAVSRARCQQTSTLRGQVKQELSGFVDCAHIRVRAGALGTTAAPVLSDRKLQACTGTLSGPHHGPASVRAASTAALSVVAADRALVRQHTLTGCECV